MSEKQDKMDILMKNLVYILVMSFVISSCSEKSEPPCGAPNPEVQLAWLQEDIADFEDATIEADYFVYQADYQGNTVFIQATCCQACNTTPPVVMNCEGVSLGFLGDGIDVEDISNKELIWRSSNNVCGEYLLL